MLLINYCIKKQQQTGFNFSWTEASSNSNAAMTPKEVELREDSDATMTPENVDLREASKKEDFKEVSDVTITSEKVALREDVDATTINPKEIELGEGNVTPTSANVPLRKKKKKKQIKKQRQKLTVDVKITFCTHVGWEGVLVMLFSFCIAGLFIFITFKYTKGFEAWHREGVWVFMVFAVLFTFLNLLYFITWKKIAKTYSKKDGEREKSAFIILRYKNMFNINGVLYLRKLYLFEFIESINQIVNVTTVYLCTMPREVTISFCIVLAVDAFYRAYQLKQKNTVARRDRQVKIDIIIDFLCVAVPLGMIWFGYGISISIPEMMQIAIWPSLCLLSKLRTILREIIRVRTDNAIIRQQNKVSSNIKRNRKSIFRRTSSELISIKQGKRIPKKVSTIFFAYNVGYGIFFLVVAIAHLVMQSTVVCVEKYGQIWAKGCENKIPFCKSLFTPTCNCVSLKIEHNKTLNMLPNELVNDMIGLRNVCK